jgi:hypothetical protein
MSQIIEAQSRPAFPVEDEDASIVILSQGPIIEGAIMTGMGTIGISGSWTDLLWLPAASFNEQLDDGMHAPLTIPPCRLIACPNAIRSEEGCDRVGLINATEADSHEQTPVSAEGNDSNWVHGNEEREASPVSP